MCSNVVVLADRNEAIGIVAVHDFSCYFEIKYKSALNTERYDLGETLLVCSSNKFHGEREAHRINESINNEGNTMTTATINFTMDVEVNEYFKLANGHIMKKVNTAECNAVDCFTGEQRNIEPNAPVFACVLSQLAIGILACVRLCRETFNQSIVIDNDALFYAEYWMMQGAWGERHMALLTENSRELGMNVYNLLDCVARACNGSFLALRVRSLQGMLALNVADADEAEQVQEELNLAMADYQLERERDANELDPAGLGEIDSVVELDVSEEERELILANRTEQANA